ncbi:transglutaminase-like domain-containing protein [Ramlibacter humi]|uniref:Transglutaminase family protein n=1 Tax=Ramlibacter humi TaxID=2530451 RepID=A0A4Z0BHI4_9BURK|nr:transglutaminase family protein [Ramlibacter humi]TFY97727.1 transglutaminase family protein [Ramlibacter humi]
MTFEYSPFGWPEPGAAWLEATEFLDHEHPAVRAFAHDAVGDARGTREKAVRLFDAVRDRIRYDPYHIRMKPEWFRASTVLQDGRAFCIPKAVLLAAAARAVGIPSAVGLSDVTNHLNSPKLRERMGGREIFLDHGWAALCIDGKWLKASPAFNAELCARMKVPPTDFDGEHDAVLQAMDAQGRQQMTYLRDHGVWSDLPYERIRLDFEGYYPGSLWLAGPSATEFGAGN